MTTSAGRRSLEVIGDADLARLADLAADDEADLFAPTPGTAGRHAGRLIARALCQGAALHYLDRCNGVKDFDAWSSYAALDDGGPPYPYRRVVPADFGPSRFGTWPDDLGRFTGRRVDLLSRSIPASISDDPAEAIRAWMRDGSKSGRALTAKAVVLIAPAPARGQVVWPSP